jgi:hypothetical protein
MSDEMGIVKTVRLRLRQMTGMVKRATVVKMNED